jgi:hypothetical protein
MLKKNPVLSGLRKIIQIEGVNVFTLFVLPSLPPLAHLILEMASLARSITSGLFLLEQITTHFPFTFLN